MKNKSQVEEINLVPIKEVGAIATPNMAQGRLIPVLIVDCSNHPKLLSLIQIHQHTPPGDVLSKWGVKYFNSRMVYLVLYFANPVETEVVFSFDLQNDHATADAIVQARGMYLQPLESGEKVITGLDQPKIIVEVPHYTALSDWDNRLLAQITKRLKREGLTKKMAKKAAIEHIATMREIWQIRGQ